MNEYEPVPSGPSVVDGAATPVDWNTAMVPAAVPVGVQVPFVNQVNVTLPVGLVANALPVETVAESYTEPPSAIDVTTLPSATLWICVTTDVSALPTVSGSQVPSEAL